MWFIYYEQNRLKLYSIMNKQLPNLNGLRFIAAAAVLLYHVNIALVMTGLKPTAYTYFPFGFGEFAVVLFFVLSGFLITWLLLLEKEHTEIDVKKFYLKRVLRIWPLYYLILAVSFLYFNNSCYFYWPGVTNDINMTAHPVIYPLLLLILCPNIAMLDVRTLGYANPTWSIGVEEQFYLIWPLIIKRTNPIKYVVGILVIVFMLSCGTLDYFLIKATTHHFIVNKTLINLIFHVSKFFTFNYSFKIDSMAIGALGAFAAKQKKELLKYIFSIPFQIVLYIITIALLMFPHIVIYQLYSLVFIIIILNLAFNPNTIVKLENKIFDYLGRISYGLYIFHSLTIIPVIHLVTRLGLRIGLQTELLIDMICMCITIGIASVSYRYFESYFLRMKSRLSKKTFKPVN